MLNWNPKTRGEVSEEFHGMPARQGMDTAFARAAFRLEPEVGTPPPAYLSP